MSRGRSRGPGYAVLEKMIEEFPDAPAKTLARMAYRKHPRLWPSFETCYSNLRYQLGLIGEKHRKHSTIKRAPRQAGANFADIIPDPLVQMKDWAALSITGVIKALILNDIHKPFHDKDALETALGWGYDKRPTHIILNGDTFDHYELSFFDKNPEHRDFEEEVAGGIQFLAGLRRAFPKARIILKHGNHEERYERFMRRHCMMFLNLKQFQWESVFELEKHNIELVRQKRPIQLGKLTIFHGHEYGGTFSNPVGAARWLYLKTGGVNAMCGHFHQPNYYSKPNAHGKIIGAWSVGCLCDLHPEYRPINDWGHGFAYVETEANGDFRVQNLSIINGEVR